MLAKEREIDSNFLLGFGSILENFLLIFKAFSCAMIKSLFILKRNVMAKNFYRFFKCHIED